MDQSAIQQGWKRSEYFLFDQQGGDQEDFNLPLGGLSDFEWNNVGHGQIATHPTSQAVAIGLKHPQVVFPGLEQSSSADLPLNLVDTEYQFPAHNKSAQPNPLPPPLSQSYQEPCFSLARHGYAYAALPASELPLNATDTGKFSANVQHFQQDLFPRPQLNDTLNSSLIPYNPTDYAAFSTFKQPLAACPCSFPQSQVKSGRCVRCWALRKQVFLLPVITRLPTDPVVVYGRQCTISLYIL